MTERAGQMDHDDCEGLPAAAEDWLTTNVRGYRGPGRLRKFGFGQSNPTFRLSTDSGMFVLRRKPLGALLPKAHAVEREFQVLDALNGSGVPIPHVHAFCEDPSVLGAAFYVMDYVEGRIFYDQRLPDLTPEDRGAVFDSMNATIAGLHSIDPVAVGLGGYGRSEDFLGRQIALWTRQYRAGETTPIDAMEQLIRWLPENTPAQQPTRIFHGDLRLDNMIFHPTAPRVIALLDWELSTLGDPVADFAYHMISWRIPADLFRGFKGIDLGALGVPAEAEYVRKYCDRVGRTELQHWDFYLAFGLFRIASILQGIRRRALDGNATAANAAEVGLRAAPLAELGWQIVQSGSE